MVMIPLQLIFPITCKSTVCRNRGEGGRVLTDYLPQNLFCDIRHLGSNSTQLVASIVLVTVSVNHSFQTWPKLLKVLTIGNW